MREVRCPPCSQAAADAAELDPYARCRHARYIEAGVTYHIISRTHGNLFLLRPDERGRLRRIVAGVLAQAKANYPSVANYATVVLSNHMHALVRVLHGDPRVLADYIAFVKRELTRRWKYYIQWSGSIWSGYRCTALITPEAELHAFDYLLSQSVKEGLVSDPRQWPGFHCAQSLTSGAPESGIWFNGTAYGKAFHAESVKKQPREVCRRDFFEPRQLTFEQLPALGYLDRVAYRAEVTQRVERIAEEARRNRRTAAPVGAAAVCALDTRASAPVPNPPWFEERRRMIVWDNHGRAEVQEYLARYWSHQRRYREAALAWTSADVPTVIAFPETSFVPGRRPRPVAHMEQSSG